MLKRFALFITLIIMSFCIISPTPVYAVKGNGGGGSGGGGGGDSPGPSTPVGPAGPIPIEDIDVEAGSTVGTFQGTATTSWTGTTGSGSATTEFEGKIKFPYSAYYPKIGRIHSVNALVAKYDNVPVYFMPKLEDFPVNLSDTVATLKDHTYAIVYSGEFDSEVQYVRADLAGANDKYQSRIATSKKVYSSVDNSRCLTLLGYDLLLKSENYNFDVEVTPEATLINMTYDAKLADGAIDANTAVMDLYKAVGEYEWDIEFAYGPNDEALFGKFDINKHPILQKITFLTSATGDMEVRGVDASQLEVYVSASRTNPDLYWNRCQIDNLFGGAHSLTSTFTTSTAYTGTEVSASFTKSKNDTVNLAEFSVLARAIMMLYGEPILQDSEMINATLAYQQYVPKNMLTDEEYQSVMYLIAKGILDPREHTDYQSPIYFSDIEMLLLRIADVDSRLSISVPTPDIMSNLGYTKTDVAISDVFFYTEDVEDGDYYDYLVEVVDGKSVWRVYKDYGRVSYDLNSEKIDYPELFAKYSSSEVLLQQFEKSEPLVSTANLCVQIDGHNYNVSSGDGKAIFEGTVEYGGKVFYHIKVKKSLLQQSSSVNLTYDFQQYPNNLIHTPDGLEYPSGAIHSVKLGPLGGVTSYDYEAKKFVYNSFKGYGVLTGYRDSAMETNWNEGLFLAKANTLTTVMYIPASKLDESTVKSLANTPIGNVTDSECGYNWNMLYHDGRLILNETVTLASYEGGKITAFAYGSPSNNTENDIIRLEITYPKSKDIKKTYFWAAMCKHNEIDSSKDTTEGYYRADDGSVLVSYNYLAEKGLVSSYVALEDGKGYMIKIDKTQSNIVLYDSEDYRYIIVGNTFIPVKDETLFVETNNTFYINVKACLGWACEYIAVPDDSSEALVLLPTENLTFFNANQYHDVYTYYPQTSTRMIQYSFGKQKNASYAFGIPLTSTYPLASYCVVMSDDNNYDYLFVWHLQDAVTKESVSATPKTYHIEEQPLEGNTFGSGSYAMADWEKLTGTKVSESSEYILLEYRLYRGTEIGASDGQASNKQGYLEYMGREAYLQAGVVANVSFGYIYRNNIDRDSRLCTLEQAIDKYANPEDTSVLLPIVYCMDKPGANALWDVNFNAIKFSEMEAYQPLGTMLASTIGNGKKGANASSTTWLSGTGTNPVYTMDDSKSEDAVTNYIITPAPAGMFSGLYQTGTVSLKELNAVGSLYYGTMKAKTSAGKGLTLGDRVSLPSIKEDATAQIAYLGFDKKYNVYTLTNYTPSVTGTLLDKAEDALSAVFGQGIDEFDWDKYKFYRLAHDADRWTSVLLIAILNILPRIMVALFFILMILSLIADVPIWRKFNQKVFDVYKFLTFGHVTVDTINMKQLVLTSIICLALFSVIMDGYLFRFIMFICEFFVELYQR